MVARPQIEAAIAIPEAAKVVGAPADPWDRLGGSSNSRAARARPDSQGYRDQLGPAKAGKALGPVPPEGVSSYDMSAAPSQKAQLQNWRFRLVRSSRASTGELATKRSLFRVNKLVRW